MSERAGGQQGALIVGADRDAGRIVSTMADGVSVLVAGSLGSGKSHLLRTVAQDLDRRGLDPIFLRTSPQLSGVPLGALDDCPDRRSTLLRNDDATPLERPIVVVVVDDAQSLDPATTDTLTRAIYRRRAVALLGIGVPRARAAGGRQPSSATGTFVDLWLHGLAERVDLRELVPADAERLLDLFCGPDRFDVVTRARIIGLADGSRILLRELAAHASAALASGADPFDALHDIHRHSRLGDALFAHAAELGEPERLALALLGRLRCIEYADAIRFLAPSLVDSLISARLVYEDGSVRRRLVANAALAAEAEHQLSFGALEDAIERAGARMLGAGGAWWSEPLAVAIAERWHGADAQQRAASEAPPPLRVRVARDAARAANDAGDPMLAIAYATLVVDGVSEDAGLVLEREHARATVSVTGHSHGSIDPSTLDGPTLRRYLRMREHVAAGISAGDLFAALAPGFASDDQTIAELEMAVAEEAAMALECAEADVAARRAVDHHGADASTRLRATLISTLSRVFDGDWAGATAFLDRANHLLHTPSVPVGLDTSDRMLALCIELLVAESAGRDAVGARDRLRDETILAARDESGPAIVLAGLGAAFIHARAGDTERAIVEIESAAHRAANLILGPAVSLFHLSLARSFALLGRVGEARVLQRREAETATWIAPLLLHDRALTDSCILAAEGAIGEALEAAEESVDLSNRVGARLLHLRDLYQIAALGAADDVVLHKMKRIADSTDMPSAHALAERAASVLRGRKSMTRRTPIERLRLGAPWSPVGAAEPPATIASTEPFNRSGFFPRGRDGIGLAAHASAALGLTRREREIAHLVAEGLSNRDIAERLFLSVRTVESHVYQARAKIGAPSRHELGRMIGRREDDRGDGTNGRH